MNKLLIGLLIIAAGAGVYFFVLKKKKEKPVTSTINKEWIIGGWKVDSVAVHPGDTTGQFNLALINTLDSNYKDYEYHFGKTELITRQQEKADTSYYEWGKRDELIIKDNAADSIASPFTVLKLSLDSLQIQSADSMKLLFRKIK